MSTPNIHHRVIQKQRDWKRRGRFWVGWISVKEWMSNPGPCSLSADSSLFVLAFPNAPLYGPSLVDQGPTLQLLSTTGQSLWTIGQRMCQDTPPKRTMLSNTTWTLSFKAMRKLFPHFPSNWLNETQFLKLTNVALGFFCLLLPGRSQVTPGQGFRTLWDLTPSWEHRTELRVRFSPQTTFCRLYPRIDEYCGVAFFLASFRDYLTNRARSKESVHRPLIISLAVYLSCISINPGMPQSGHDTHLNCQQSQDSHF